MSLFLLAQTEALFNNAALAAAGAAAVAIPVAIHLLSRLRRRPIPWAAMRFLQEAFRRHRQRLRIEQLLLLLVRCMVVLLLGLALAGPLVGGFARQLAAGAQGRVVCIVLDDALSTQADIGGRARFDRLRDTALTLLESLEPADLVGVWRAAMPPDVLLSPAAVDVASARQALQSLKPRYSRADLVGALRLVAGAVSDEAVVRPGEPVKVVILSDFSVSAIDLDKPLPSVVADLQQRAQAWFAAPQPAAANVQIAALLPRRRTVLASGFGAASVAVDLKLRRFAGDDNAAMTGAALRLVDPVSQTTLSSIRREHRWAAGQTEATLNVQMPIDDPASMLPPGAAGRMLAVEASIEPADDADALDADNHACTTIEWRQRITVGIVDDSTDVVAGADGQFAPRDWLGLALMPRGEELATSPVELIALSAAQLDRDATATLDAVFVTRPDRLTDRGIAALDELAQRGGLVWITPPRAASSAVWAPALAEQLKLDARLGINIAEAPADEPWQLAIDGAAPQGLSMLGADWEALLRPVRIVRTLRIEPADPSAVWLSMRGPSGGAWMTVHPRGRGALALLGSAVDPDWSNLPTRPLFVPLLHETLRCAVGGSTAANVISGQEAELDASWRGVQRLVRSGGGGAVSLVHEESGSHPAQALVRPGVYVAEPSDRGLQLAVNADAAGGDTRALDAQRVAAHLGAQRLDENAPGAILAEQAERTDVGWPLLWTLLAMLLLESALARWFSHAHRNQRGLKLTAPGEGAA